MKTDDKWKQLFNNVLSYVYMIASTLCIYYILIHQSLFLKSFSEARSKVQLF